MNPIVNIKFKHSLLFILFFPQLIAGPWKGRDLIPQNILVKFKVNEINLKNGTYLLAIGLFRKYFFDILVASYEEFYTKGSLGSTSNVL